MTDRLDRLQAALADRYRIARELGAGGMATVYLAHDLRHERQVALKVIRPELAVALGAERFLREIRITAQLTHPHILPLLDSGDVGGILYYVMPYVAGESLRERLTRERQLPVDDALRIAREVADALSYAHRHDVVHRDIKPENILLESGHAVVADFGIARAVRDAGGDRITETGLSVGTPTYMSPEQAAGDRDIDGRSDVYALGCVLYEMLAGQPPFTGPTLESVIHQHMVAEPPSIVNLRPGVPDAVVAVLARALAKTPADRFSPAAQFGDALAPVSAGLTLGPSRAAAPVRGPGSRWAVAAAAAGVIVVVGGLALLSGGDDRRPSTDAAASLAVLPFASLGGGEDQDYFGDGLADELMSALSKVEGLRVAGRASAFFYKGQTVDAREVGRQLDVDAVLEGSVQRSGDRIRVRAQLTNARDGFTMWTETYDRQLADLFAVQDDLARAIVRALAVRLQADSGARLVSAPGTNLDAYNAYLQGRYHWNRRTTADAERAVELFEAAIAADSNYAPAWSGLADAYVLLLPSNYPGVTIEPDEAMRRAEAAARRAVALNPDLAESHASLGIVHHVQWRWAEAASELRRALELNPNYATARYFLGYGLLALNRVPEAVREFEAAHRADPLSLIIGVWLADAYRAAGDLQRADATWKRLLGLFPTSLRVRQDAFLHALIRGRWEEAGEHLVARDRVDGVDEDRARRWADALLREATRRPAMREMVDAGAVGGSRAVALLVLAGDLDAAAARADEEMVSPARAGMNLSSLRARIPDARLFRHPRFRVMLQRVGVDWD